MEVDNPQEVPRATPAVIDEIDRLVDTIYTDREHVVMGQAELAEPIRAMHPRLPHGMRSIGDVKKYLEQQPDFEERMELDAKFRQVYNKVMGLLGKPRTMH